MSTGKIIDVGLSLDQEYIKASVENIVKAGIVQALGNPADLVQQAINMTINRKVDKDGKPTNSSWDSRPYLEWLANKVVEDTVRQAMTEAVKANANELREEMIRQISTKQFKNSMASAFVKAVITSAEMQTWKMPITVSFETPKEN
jgi:hypothetical protein